MECPFFKQECKEKACFLYFLETRCCSLVQIAKSLWEASELSKDLREAQGKKK